MHTFYSGLRHDASQGCVIGEKKEGEFSKVQHIQNMNKPVKKNHPFIYEFYFKWL